MIIRLIRDEKDPDAELAAVARAAYKASVLKVISKLPWKDFEQKDTLDFFISINTAIG